MRLLLELAAAAAVVVLWLAVAATADRAMRQPEHAARPAAAVEVACIGVSDASRRACGRSEPG